MKKPVAVLCMFAVTMVLTSCRGNPSTPSSSEQSSSSAISNADNREDAASAVKGSTTTTTTTTTDEETTITHNENSITEQESPTQPNISLPDPPSSIALKDLNYWGKADSFRVYHTQSPPFKAETLKKGTEEYNTLLSLLQQVEGTYLGISHEGLAGGFMPIYVCQGTTEVDRILIDITGDARFSTDTQQEGSRQGLAGKYASLYVMSGELSNKIKAFLETLEYTEDI